MSELKQLLDAGEKSLKRRKGGIDAVRRQAFLRELMRVPIVGVAARRAGLSISEVYRERDKSKIFRVACDQAMTSAIDDVEVVLVEKAYRGDLKAIEMFLKARRPERYRERHEVALVSDSTIEVNLVKVNKTPESGLND
jgi:hypothetical protein